MNTTTSTDFHKVLTRFKGTFAAAAAERDKRPDFDQATGELGWVMFERHEMLKAVDAERAARGLPPVSIDHVETVERSACGHVDYAQKYALGCTELALGYRDR